MRNNLRTVFSA